MNDPSLFVLTSLSLSLSPEQMWERERERKKKSKEASALSLSLIEQSFGWIVDHDRKWSTWMILSPSLDRHLWEWGKKEEKNKRGRKKRRRLSRGIDWNDVLLCDIQLHRNQWKTRLIQFLIKRFSFFLSLSLCVMTRGEEKEREREKKRVM